MPSNSPKIVFSLACAILSCAMVQAQTAEPYRMPPRSIADIADAPPTPRVLLDPTKTWMATLEYSAMPSIAELSREELRLAGIRIDPATNARSRRRTGKGLSLTKLADGSEHAIRGLPNPARIDDVQFSPDGKHLALSHTTDSGMELWVVNVASAEARKLSVSEALNGVYYGNPFVWLSDNQTIVAKVVPADRGPRPVMPRAPEGPVIQQSGGTTAAARTYQDLLTSPHDETLFAHYMTARLVTMTLDGQRIETGAPTLIASVSPSPDGQHLLVTALERPFSYLVPARRFAHRTEVWNRKGELEHELAKLPLAENVPIGRNAVPTGPRSFGWRADADATAYWVEAQDGGDPSKDAAVRDKVFMLEAPFTEKPVELAETKLRFRNLQWGDDGRALIHEWWWQSRRERITLVAPGSPSEPARELFDYSYEDRYRFPGRPLTASTTRGTRVLLIDEGRIFLTAEGASPEGNRPFLDALNLQTVETERLFRSQSPYYEFPIDWIDLEKQTLLTRRESKNEPPNFFARDLKTDSARELTDFPHPYPELEGVQRELIRYDRADGVKLSATLHLPAKYTKSSGPLPMLVWAYPREYKSADAAAQVRDSPHKFSRIGWGSPLYWLTRGFAVMENATMPIVGEGSQEPNDSYIEQLVASGQAAVDEAVRRGVADRDRVAIAGHSYGAFMTANLLAHSDIFRAGIARSGAFNRTLTPFGFQSEQRTFWQAPEIYFKMSPFMHAHKINEPILLTHGDADNNSGTFPIQSRRLFHALKGHGATARLVMLPHESHGYRARESVMHTLWEMDEWLERYVKNAEPRGMTNQ